MSKKLCPLCRETAYKFPEHNIPNGLYHCGMCEKNFTDEEVLNDDLFHRITQSEKTLAENVVYPYEMAIGGSMFRVYWTSPFVENFYIDKAEAIAATVAKLKEVYNETTSD